MPQANEESLLGNRGSEALPLLNLDLLEAVNKLHPGFADWFVSNVTLKNRVPLDVQRLLLHVGLFYRLTQDTVVLKVLFYAGYLQGEKDERKRLEDLFGKEIL